jgi:REP element-mobilizing transposase RayT
MPRPLRIEYPGAIYHVMNRGDRREAIYRDEKERATFLRTLGEACGKTGWQVHAWCLIGNHFHLVLETPQANLVAGMRWLLGTFTVRFNRRHGPSGHLFGGRYKAQHIDERSGAYLVTACDYVHLNPVRASLVPPEEPLESWK